MKRLQNELTSLVNRGMDRHLRLAVTGLSRSGKTAFITSLVNQLLHVHSGARLPLFSAVRDERLLGVKRVPQRDLGIQRLRMMKAWLLCMVRHQIGQRRPVASAKSVWRYVFAPVIRCCAILKRHQRCIWRLLIIPGSGYWIYPCWSRTI